MSSSLVWKPIEPVRGTLPNALKFVLRKRSDTWPQTFCQRDLDYLNGLIDCEVEGAKELYQLILEHGEVELREEH